MRLRSETIGHVAIFLPPPELRHRPQVQHHLRGHPPTDPEDGEFYALYRRRRPPIQRCCPTPRVQRAFALRGYSYRCVTYRTSSVMQPQGLTPPTLETENGTLRCRGCGGFSVGIVFRVYVRLCPHPHSRGCSGFSPDRIDELTAALPHRHPSHSCRHLG